VIEQTPHDVVADDEAASESPLSDPVTPEHAAAEEAADTPAVPEVDETPPGAADEAPEGSGPEESEPEPPATEPPAADVLEAAVEEVEETALTTPDAEELEGPEPEPVVESPTEPVETEAEMEEPLPDTTPEPVEETVAEAAPEVAEEIEAPAADVDAVAAEESVVVVGEPEEEVAAEAAADEAAVAAEVEEEAAEPPVRDPFRGPGEWYVVHTYAGYENKVKANLESRIGSMQMQDKIFEVEIPMEDVMEIKGGKKQVVQKKVFPGYLLVKMIYDNDSWYVVRNTPGVTGFVSSGTGTKPTPLSKREVDKILAVKKEEIKPTFRLEFEEGDVVRIISGPFADFNGTVDEINFDQSKLKVLVNIFDRETPVELGFDQVAKV
jgi:transcription termination/antitermination protein NusG